MQRIEIQTQVARLLDDLLVEGKIDAATAPSLTDSELTFPQDNQIRGCELYLHTCVSGTVAGQARVVSAFGASGNIATVDPNWAYTPTIGDSYHLYKTFKAADYIAAIDLADKAASNLKLLPFTATMGLVATQYEYAVPSGLKYIYDIWEVPSGSSDFTLDIYHRLPRKSWRVESKPSGSRVIMFNPACIDMDDYDADLALVLGQRSPKAMSAGTHNSEVSDEFLINKAASILAARRIAEGQEWVQKYQHFNREASQLEKYLRTPCYPDSEAI